MSDRDQRDDLEIPSFFTEAVEIQLHKFRNAHSRIVTPGQTDLEVRGNFIAAGAAIVALRDMTRDQDFRERSPVECEIVRGIVVALEVMFATLTIERLP